MLYVNAPTPSRDRIVGGLRDADVDCDAAGDSAVAYEKLARGDVEVLVVSQVVAPPEGGSWLSLTQQRWPDLPVILVEPTPDRARVVEALRGGAVEVVDADAGPDEFRFAINKALARLELAEEEPPPASRLIAPSHDDGIVGKSSALQAAMALVEPSPSLKPR